jgi:hypothetical protein
MDVAELSIPASGQFFKVAKSADTKFVKSLFASVKTAVGAKNLLGQKICEPGTLNKIPFSYSFAGFEIKQTPSFLKKSDLREKRYGFVLLLEICGYFGLFKKGIAGLDEELTTIATLIGRAELTRAYSSRAVYKKLSLRRMTVSHFELIASSYEADDLESTLPNLAASRSIPRYIRLNSADRRNVAITPATSRIHVSGEKINVSGAARFTLEVGGEFQRPAAKTFLDSFALPLKKSNLPAGVSPTGIHFDLSKLYGSGAAGTTAEIVIKDSKGDTTVTKEVEKRLARVLRLTQDGSNWKVAEAGGTRQLGELKWPKERMLFSLRTRRNLHVIRSDGDEQGFESWLREENAFSVCFSDYQYFYAAGQLFRRNDLMAEIRLLERLIEPVAGLDSATSEKGDWKNGKKDPYPARASAFRKNSTFFVLEEQIAKADDHVLCGDLGDEWADYLVLDKNKRVLSFCHCKAGDISPGGSAFHIVVGQALKNLGRVQVVPLYLKEKLDEAESRRVWGQTKIRLLRRAADTWPAFKASVREFVLNPVGRWEVCLVVTMLSKKRFIAEARANPMSPEFIQQVWLLTAFVNSCREKGAMVRIYCCS